MFLSKVSHSTKTSLFALVLLFSFFLVGLTSCLVKLFIIKILI